MSDWYPFEEETPLPRFRWYQKVEMADVSPMILQQKWRVRQGDKVQEEWREIETLIDIIKP